MSVLQPFFSLTPLDPYHHTYGMGDPQAPYAQASLYSYGGYTSASHSYWLSDQHSSDEIILSDDPVELADQAIGSVPDDLYRRCTIRLCFTGWNVSTKNQYLLLLALRGIRQSPTAQFFVGTDFVRAEELSGDETVAILLDCPGPNRTTEIYVRLASPVQWATMGFKGVDCYLL